MSKLMTLTNERINDLMNTSLSDNGRMHILANIILDIRFLNACGYNISTFISYLFRTMEYTGIDYSNSIELLKSEFPAQFQVFKQWNS